MDEFEPISRRDPVFLSQTPRPAPTPAPAPEPGHRPVLTTLQAGRAAAALLVVLAHATTISAGSNHLGYPPLLGLFACGHIGVDFFFGLSGFVIASAHWRDVGNPARLSLYLKKRAIRIYPAYWISSALLIALALSRLSDSVTASAGTLTLRRALDNVLLLPGPESPFLGVAWTLRHEVFFYALFAALIASRRAGAALLAAWVLLIAAVAATSGPSLRPWETVYIGRDFIASTYNVQFLTGAAAALLFRRHTVPRPALMLALGTIGFMAVGELENLGVLTALGQAERLLLALFVPMILLGLADLERSGRLGATALLDYLGAASYSIYLVHVPLIFLLAETPGSASWPGGTVLLYLAAVSAAGGCLFHSCIEMPLTRWLRRRAGLRPEPRALARALNPA